MHILEFIKSSTPAQCREVGELILSFADLPRNADFRANIDTALVQFRDPQETDLVATLERARARVHVLNDALLEDGTDHARLLAEELDRRGDKRSVDEYCTELAGTPLHGDPSRSDSTRSRRGVASKHNGVSRKARRDDEDTDKSRVREAKPRIRTGRTPRR